MLTMHILLRTKPILKTGQFEKLVFVIMSTKEKKPYRYNSLPALSRPFRLNAYLWLYEVERISLCNLNKILFVMLINH